MERNYDSAPLYDSRDAGVLYSGVCLLPSVLAVLFTIVLTVAGAQDQTGSAWYRYCVYLLPQAGFFLTLVLFSAWKKRPAARGLKLRFRPKYLAVIALLSFGTLFGLSELNGLFIALLEKLGLSASTVSPPLDGGLQYALSMLIVALLPSLLEETVFRGVMLEGMRGMGTAAAVLLSGALFSLFHQNPAQTPYQFVCGAVYALVAIRSGALLPTVILHFLNNAFILTFSFVAGPQYVIPSGVRLGLTIGGLACFAAALVCLVFFDKGGTEKRETPRNFLLYASVGMAFSLLVWIAGLFL